VLALGVLEALCESEINDVDIVLGLLSCTDQEVVWLDVSVDDSLLVYFLDSLDL
jgi:hypothetical protein